MSLSSGTIDEDEAGSAPAPGLTLRLKQWLIAPVRLLARLRHAKVSETGEDAEEVAARPPPHNRSNNRPHNRSNNRLEEEAKQETVSATTPPLWRRLWPYGLVLLAGLAMGGGLMYALDAKVLAQKADELDRQAAEVTRLQALVAGYDKLVLKNDKVLASEKGRRAEAENRLASAQADLARLPQVDQGTRTDQTAGSAGQAVQGNQRGRCTLQSNSLGQTLKACLDEFNHRR